MKVTVTYEYENGTIDSEYKDFDEWTDAEYYADKQKERPEVKAVWIR